jgi:hypothetical protein
MLEASALVATAATALLLTKPYVSDRRCPPKTHLEIEQKIFQCWRECFPHARRFAHLGKGLPEISSHVANETMHRHLCDAVADDRVHGSSHGAEGWFIEPREIQLRFG